MNVGRKGLILERAVASHCMTVQFLATVAACAAYSAVATGRLGVAFIRHCVAGRLAAAPPRNAPATGAATGPATLALGDACLGLPVRTAGSSAPLAAGGLLAAAAAAGRRGRPRQRSRTVARRAESATEGTRGDTASPEGSSGSTVRGQAKPSAAELRTELESAVPPGGYTALSKGQRSAVSGFFFPDAEELDMDKSMPLEDHIRELREGLIRAGIAVVICVSICLTFYKELTSLLESPALANGVAVKFVQLAPGEFFFVSLKAAVAVGLLLAFPYALFEAALYFTPALTKSERTTVGPVVLASAVLFYCGVVFAFSVLSPAALGFFINYSQDVIESQFSIDQYFEFILSMGFATGLAFQVPVLQVALGLLNIIGSEQLFSIWRYVVVASAVVGAILTPSTDPITQLLLSGALCGLYFAGAGALVALGR